MPYRHEIAVRYGEVDHQGVVFNAHYLAYLDDATDCWLRELDADFESTGWEAMVKRADVVWSGAAGIGDRLVIDSRIASWGRTSFVVHHNVSVGDRLVASADITYVGVETGTAKPVEPPAAIRRHLGEPTGTDG
jgi:acyl-CoA thioester hydrolase